MVEDLSRSAGAAMALDMEYQGRGANWAVGGRPLSRGRGACIIDGSDDPSVRTDSHNLRRPRCG
jgi:hypothetical protein